jgi:hypothetical protein
MTVKLEILSIEENPSTFGDELKLKVRYKGKVYEGDLDETGETEPTFDDLDDEFRIG